jgi:chromosome segregation ATPase
MSEETRMIMEELRQMNKTMSEMKSDISELKTDMSVLKTDVAVLKTDVAVLKTDVAVLKTEVSVLKSDMRTVKDDIADLEAGQRELYLLIENDVSKKINIIGEGHFFVMKNLKELRGFQEEKEMMDLKILDLQIEMKRVKRYLKIA